MDARSPDALARAQKELRRACSLLTSPSSEALVACEVALKAAVTEVEGWLSARGAVSVEPGLRDVASELRRTAGHAERLLEAAAGYHSERMQRICVMARGYSADGSPVGMPQGFCGVSLRA